MLDTLGVRIRQVRKAKELTLKDVSHMTGLTVSLLSQIENGKSNPSVASLISISRVLDVPVGSLIDFGEQPKSPVTRRADRKVNYVAGGVSYRLMIPDDHQSTVGAAINEYAPGSSSGNFHTHEGTECGIVLSGKLEVCIDDEKYILNEGDSIYFESNRPHKISNRYDGVTTAIWIDTPPLF